MEHRIVSDHRDTTNLIPNKHIKCFVRLRPISIESTLNKAKKSENNKIIHNNNNNNNDINCAILTPSDPKKIIFRVDSAYNKRQESKNQEIELIDSDDDSHIDELNNIKNNKKLNKFDRLQQKYQHPSEHIFNFDQIFSSNNTQDDIFDITTKPLINKFLNGFNICIFAYGQTGSGKTFTIFGDPNINNNTNNYNKYNLNLGMNDMNCGIDITGERRGLIPRVSEYLFERINNNHNNEYEFSIKVSFLEIYCDRIRDLSKPYLYERRKKKYEGVVNNNSIFLDSKTSIIYQKIKSLRKGSIYRPTISESYMSSPRSYQSYHTYKTSLSSISNRANPEELALSQEYIEMNLKIHEDQNGNVFVKDLSKVKINSNNDLIKLINSGLKLRATHETKLNLYSSRSHTVFTIELKRKNIQTGKLLISKMHLIDLAGSERIKKSESIGQRLQEALHINQSLTSLGKVIMALDTREERNHIPYRDSLLTRILQNSLGGNSFTTLLATVNPSKEFGDENLSTLHFANRCRNISSSPKINYRAPPIQIQRKEDLDEINILKDEVNNLKRKISSSSLLSGENIINTGKKMIYILKNAGVEVDNILDKGVIKLKNGKYINIYELIDNNDTYDINNNNNSDNQLMFNNNYNVNNKNNYNISNNNDDYNNSYNKNNNKKNEDISNYNNLDAKGFKIQRLSEEKNSLIRRNEELLKTIENFKRNGLKNKSISNKKLYDMKKIERKLKTELQMSKNSLKYLENKNNKEKKGLIKELYNHNEKIIKEKDELIETLLNNQQDNNNNDTHNFNNINNKNQNIYNENDIKLLKEHYENKKNDLINNHNELEKLYNLEKENLKSQFKYFLNEKDNEINYLVNNFNKYLNNLSYKLNEYENQILILYPYSEAAANILDNLNKGHYPIHHINGKSLPIIPPNDIPPNIFKNKSCIEMAQKVIKKYEKKNLLSEKLNELVFEKLTKAIEENEENDKLNKIPFDLKGNLILNNNNNNNNNNNLYDDDRNESRETYNNDEILYQSNNYINNQKNNNNKKDRPLSSKIASTIIKTVPKRPLSAIGLIGKRKTEQKLMQGNPVKTLRNLRHTMNSNNNNLQYTSKQRRPYSAPKGRYTSRFNYKKRPETADKKRNFMNHKKIDYDNLNKLLNDSDGDDDDDKNDININNVEKDNNNNINEHEFHIDEDDDDDDDYEIIISEEDMKKNNFNDNIIEKNYKNDNITFDKLKSMNIDELNETYLRDIMQNLINNDLINIKKEIENNVMKDLKDHDTILYIEKLEEDKYLLEENMKNLQKKLTKLHVVNESLLRQNNKIQKKKLRNYPKRSNTIR